MTSAALRFIPKEELEKQGNGEGRRHQAQELEGLTKPVALSLGQLFSA